MILDLAENRGDRAASPDRDRGRDISGAHTDVMKFPVSATGRIIGSRGAAISEIRQQSGAQVRVEKLDDCCKVHITGSHDEVERARTLLLKVQEEGAIGGSRIRSEA